MTRSAAQVIDAWPEPSQEAAQLVIDTYGEPTEATDSELTWVDVGPWKRMRASRTFHDHRFPTPHIDSVTSVIEYRVPPERVSDVVAFDGSVVIERTTGEVSARCHDEQANFLALNLMHDIVTGARDVEDARRYYAKEFLDYRRGEPTPYMDQLHVPAPDGQTADPDTALLSEEDLEEAVAQGRG